MIDLVADEVTCPACKRICPRHTIRKRRSLANMNVSVHVCKNPNCDTKYFTNPKVLKYIDKNHKYTKQVMDSAIEKVKKLTQCGMSQAKAAEAVGIPPTTVWDWMNACYK